MKYHPTPPPIDRFHPTARARNGLSAPMRQIDKMRLIHPSDNILHFGEGRAFEDTRLMEAWTQGDVTAYEPYGPDESKHLLPSPDKKFSLIISIYVLNTLQPEERLAAIDEMKARVTEHGYIIAALRTDEINGTPYRDGVLTGRGTFQKTYWKREDQLQVGYPIYLNRDFVIVNIPHHNLEVMTP